MSSDASNLGEPPFERRKASSEDQLLRIYHDAGSSEVSGGQRTNVKRTVAGDVSSEVVRVELKTAEDFVTCETASGLGAFVLVAKETDQELPAELRLLRKNQPTVIERLSPFDWAS